MKPIKEIYGNPAFLPAIGSRAVVYCEGDRTMITSTVVDVRNLTEKGVEIETKNTVYKLTYFGDGSLPYAV